MKQHQDRRAIIGTLSVMILAAIVVGLVFLKTSQDDSQESVASARVETTIDGHSYCAKLNAIEVDQDKIEVTITNCGDATIMLTINNRKKGGKLVAGKEYETVLRNGKEVYVTLETVDGEYLGGLGY